MSNVSIVDFQRTDSPAPKAKGQELVAKTARPGCYIIRKANGFFLELRNIKTATGVGDDLLKKHTLRKLLVRTREAAIKIGLAQIDQYTKWDAGIIGIENPFARVSAKPAVMPLTVGRYLELVHDFTPLPARTLGNYSYGLRRIAWDISGLKLTANKFDPRGKWRDLADAVQLAKITPVAVEDWRNRFVRAHRDNPLQEQRATRSANSYLRNARSLFSRRILEAMRKRDVFLPDPLPFAGVRLERKVGSTRYRSQIDAGALLSAARRELADTDADAYAVVLLALGAGLRRSEIDALQTANVLSEKGIIRVVTTAQSRVKTDESEGDVFVDPGIFTELSRTRRDGRTSFVVQPDTPRPRTRAAPVYRCAETFVRVTVWLRRNGVSANKPIHTLRKEFGSVVASAGDIHQAQRQLRHAQISTTEQFYADARKRATVPVSTLIRERKPTENPLQMQLGI